MKNKFCSIIIQLVLLITILIIVPIAFISTLLLKKMSYMSVEDLTKSQAQIVLQYMSKNENILLQYEDSLNHIARNTIVLNTLIDPLSDTNSYVKGNNISAEVNKSLNLQVGSEFHNCMIYSNVKDNKIYGNRVTMESEAHNEFWYQKNIKYNDHFSIYKSLTTNDYILSLMKDINYYDIATFKSKNIGTIKLDISADKLFAPITDSEEDIYPYDVIVLDNQDNIIYLSNKDYKDYDNVFKESSFEELQNGKLYKDINKIVFSEVMDSYGMKFIFIFDNNQLRRARLEITQTFVPVIILVIVITLFIGYMFTKRLSKRMDKLMNKIKVAETGNLTVSEEIGGNDEIAVLDRQFNRMLVKLDNLIKKNYIQRLENREAELGNLRLQINPHFLYNTLETISSIAVQENIYVICELCEKLGSIFRYSLGKNFGEFVTVDEEIEHTQNYLYIQQKRFGGKLAVFYNIEPEYKEMLIPRFILQPIVENAVAHGLRDMVKKGTIEISVEEEKGMLAIKITDDGVGMSKEMVDELVKFINKDKLGYEGRKKGIGIRNVNRRVKLTCGNKYGITIESAENEGSCFTIWLPLDIKGGTLNVPKHFDS